MALGEEEPWERGVVGHRGGCGGGDGVGDEWRRWVGERGKDGGMEGWRDRGMGE